MFHLLVTANKEAWELPAYEYPRDQFLGYTSSWLKDKYSKLTAPAIEELTSFPALFAYEDESQDARAGYIRHIRERGRSVRIEYVFDESIPKFPFAKIAGLKTQLHIEDWELNRTHWAIKEKDLLQVLVGAGVASHFFANAGGKAGRVEEMQFKVALSFPGEKREYVGAVAAELKKRLPPGSVFYDKDFTAQLARPNLNNVLQRIYLQNSDLVVVFFCAEYEKKKWCAIEWRAIRGIINNRDDHSLMPMRFDNANITGLMSHDGYVDLSEYTPEQAAELIVERVLLNDRDAEPS